MPSEFAHACFANYSPRGVSEPSKRSQRITDALKKGHVPEIEQMTPQMSEPAAAHLGPFLNVAVTLVPVPRSTPIK